MCVFVGIKSHTTMGKSLEHIKKGCVVLRKYSNSNFRLKICPVSLTFHLHMRVLPYAYKDG